MEVELIRISAAIVDGDKVNHCGSLIFCDHEGESINRSFTFNSSVYGNEVTLGLSNINLPLLDKLVSWSRNDCNIKDFFYCRQMNIAGWFSNVGSLILRLASSPLEALNFNSQTEIDDF